MSETHKMAAAEHLTTKSVKAAAPTKSFKAATQTKSFKMAAQMRPSRAQVRAAQALIDRWERGLADEPTDLVRRVAQATPRGYWE